MPAHQAGANLEVLLLGSFPGAEDALDAARVGREILLHEDVDAFLHCILQVRRAESGVRGQHGDVAGPQAINGMAVGIEAQETALGRHVNPLAQRLGQGVVGLINLLLPDVGHGDELDWAAGTRKRGPLGAAVVAQDKSARRHGIGHGPTAASAAADQGEPNRVVLGGVHVRQRHACQGRGRGEPASVLYEFAS